MAEWEPGLEPGHPDLDMKLHSCPSSLTVFLSGSMTKCHNVYRSGGMGKNALSMPVCLSWTEEGVAFGPK